MSASYPRLRILSVGGNAISAFLSWRLQATNACDVTLVWKSHYDAVAQYGIQFKSTAFGTERFKPHNVIRAPEDASRRTVAFDYVLLCVKALPDVYDLASVIESVVTPQHTCIIVNTSNTIGIEASLEERFPTNVVLSLVSTAGLGQLGPSEFEHYGSSSIWVGPANKNPAIPAAIQHDMADALAMTLNSGSVDCQVSSNIQQQQFERMIGPIAFNPTSVIFQTPDPAELIQKTGVRAMIEDTLDELIKIAISQDCHFSPTFKREIFEKESQPSETPSIMYQDYIAGRPLEIETFLGAPVKLAASAGIPSPRLHTLYTILHNLNAINQNKPPQASPPLPTPPVRNSSGVPRPPQHNPNAGPNYMPNGYRGRPMPNGQGPPRRGGGTMGGYSQRPGGPGGQLRRQGSFDQDLEEFSHVVLFDENGEGQEGYSNGHSDLALRERELALRQKELALREREMAMRRPGRQSAPMPRRQDFDDDDDDDDGDYFDANAPTAPVLNDADVENFDMMSVTSRRNRKNPASASSLRRDPNMGGAGNPYNGMRQHHSFPRPTFGRNRTASRLQDLPSVRDSILENPMMAYSSNRYGTVDRKTMGDESRTNSLTMQRLTEMGGPPGMHPPRRTSFAPNDGYGSNLNPNRRVSNRPSPPNEGMYPGGPPNMNGPRSGTMPYRPGPGGMPVPPDHQGVSKPFPYKGGPAPNVRSLTGSASASAGSGSSAQIDSENSAHSSQSSVLPRNPVGVR